MYVAHIAIASDLLVQVSDSTTPCVCVCVCDLYHLPCTSVSMFIRTCVFVRACVRVYVFGNRAMAQ